MKTKLTSLKTVFLTTCLLIVTGFINEATAQCHAYISQTVSTLKFTVKLTGLQQYVEVFASKNGQQNIAQNITSSAVNNGDGTYTYSYSTALTNYATGDAVLARFYSYLPAKPAVFTPGPSEGNWSQAYFINQTNCNPNPPQFNCEYPSAGTMKLAINQDGSVKFSITFNQMQAYIELFSQKNGQQNIAANIVGSQVANLNGTFTYSYTTATNTYTQGNVILYRFYSYVAAQPAVFNPGPNEGVWSQPVTYNPCVNAAYVSILGSDSNPGTKTAPVRNINKGIAIAITNQNTEVRVAEGTYTESAGYSNFYTMINVQNGISLIGGFAPDFNNTPDTSHHTIIHGPNGGTQAAGPRILSATNITNPTTIAYFTIENGVTQAAGGGIYTYNSNNKLIVRNNIVKNNYATYSGYGGNIYLQNSAAQIYDNKILFGFCPSHAADLQITGPYIDDATMADIHHNTFTCNTTMYVDNLIFANFHDNNFLCLAPSAAQKQESAVISNQGENVIQISNLTSPVFTIEVYNLMGQLQYSTSNVSTFSLNDLQPGIYAVSVIQGDQKSTKMTYVK